MDEELFQEWLQKSFVRKIRHLGKVLLITDGHGSHVTLDVIDLARESNICSNSTMFTPSHYIRITTTGSIFIFAIEKLFF